ncbi:MAG: hypothetical protein WA949_21780 [Phormidesmis sp.]
MVDIVDRSDDYEELKRHYESLTEEIQFLQNSDRTDDLSPRDRFRLRKQISEAKVERTQVEQQLKDSEKDLEVGNSTAGAEDVYLMLRRLGYQQQIRLFRQTIESEPIAAFLIHGYPEHGQSWLLNRIVVQYVPYFLTGKVIGVHASRKIRQNDASALWREVAGRVGLRGRQYTPSEIAQQVGQCLSTQNVLLVFHDVEILPEATLHELIQDFWLPLVNEVQAQLSSQGKEQSKYKLLMFLIDYEGCVEESEVLFAEKLDESWKSTVPIKSPKITEFSDGDLLDWVEAEFDRLPPALTARVDDEVRAILESTENGIPELVLDVICNYCGFDWYEESKKWLNL